MRRAVLTAAILYVAAGAIWPAGATAGEDGDSSEQSGPIEKDSTATKPASQTGPDAATPKKVPPDAASALVRAEAAYEYGDLNQVVESARFVTEGSLQSTQWQQAQAFRLLGIGLYLTNRPLGAEAAFTELLRREPRARLDPTTTRPEIVSFFESLRRQHLVRQRSTRKIIWNFLPPLGQFQNDDNVKGWAILTLGVLSGATCATSYGLYKSWERSDGTFNHEDVASKMKTVNIVSGAVTIAIVAYGIVDGLLGYSKPLDESRVSLSPHFFPGGGGLGFTF